MRCERCQALVFKVLLHGTELLCQVCLDEANGKAKSAHSVIGDDIPGGLWVENLQHEPMQFYSKKAIGAAADARGLRLTDKWAGPHDQHLTNWAASIDAVTLANAAELLTRRARRDVVEPADDIVCETAQFTVEVK